MGIVEKPSLVVATSANSVEAEAYRTLRTNLEFACATGNIRSLLVTSATEGEGKSTVVANLGASFSRVGKRVIIVDCNLRKPRLHEFFGMGNGPGVADLLSGEAEVNQVLRKTSEAGLQIITAGTLGTNPIDLLSNKRMKDVLEQLVDLAEIILFDSPAVLPVADALVIGNLVDGILLVIGAGQAVKDEVAQAQQALGKTKGRLLGSVLNNIKGR